MVTDFFAKGMSATCNTAIIAGTQRTGCMRVYEHSLSVLDGVLAAASALRFPGIPPLFYMEHSNYWPVCSDRPRLRG